MQHNTETKIWNATLYLRLSRDDGDKEESNSITGQRELLRDFIRTRPELREYAVRIDDGFTGSNFERPSFKKMLEDVKAGRTNCIIVKDLSRFGRNYLDAGEYIEKIFPFLGVRFIAVNDNYDSLGGKNASDELIIPFKNLINEAYCRDISVKVHTQLEVKRKSGQYIGAFAVYGYLKDNADKNHLIVDEYAADTVRDIFSWKLEGMSPQDIAARLNHSGVLSPMEYKRSLGMRFATSFKANPQAAWSANAVLRILKNPVYTGILIQGRETTPSYKVRKRITKPENEWAIVSDAYEAIVERRDFDSVQKALSLDTRRSPGDSAVQLFSGMVFCGECGASMVRKTVPSGKKKYVYYICSAHKQDKSCSPHRMRDKALEQLVLDTVKQYIRDVVDLDDILAMTDTAPLRTAEAQKVQRQLDKKRSEHERLQKLLMSLYESLADGIIDRDEYARLKQNYAGRCAECEKQMDAVQETLTQIREHGGGHREWIKTSDQLNLPTPTPVYHNEVSQPTPLQKQMVQELSERAAKVHAGSVDASTDNMLKITSDGRKLGLDQRVINPDLPDDPNSKVNLCVNNIHLIWQDGQTEKLTQLVFCDLSTPKGKAAQSGRIAAKGTDSPELHALEAAIDAETEPEKPPFTIYDDIREKLVSRGIPREQIAFIHEANTEVRKKELFAKVRSGQVRVLMGSTFKMGAGMNVQDRLVALHDLDCPWRPGDLEQRSGRIIRQGNRNKEVHIYRYVTESTFDAYLWQTVENKEKFISQIMT